MALLMSFIPLYPGTEQSYHMHFFYFYCEKLLFILAGFPKVSLFSQCLLAALQIPPTSGLILLTE